MIKSWVDYASAAHRIYSTLGVIPIAGEFGQDLEEISLDLITKCIGDEKKEIRILINSSGGSSTACIAIRNALLLSRIKTTGIVLSRAYSSAFYLLQACDTRIAIEGATLLLHWGSTRLGNNELAAIMRGEAWPVDHIREFNGSMIEAIANRTGIASEKLSLFADSERYFTAKEAKKEGFIDVIVPSLTSEIPADMLKLLLGS